MAGSEKCSTPNPSHRLVAPLHDVQSVKEAFDLASGQGLHLFRFGAGAVLAESPKIKILGSCIDESPKGFGSI